MIKQKNAAWRPSSIAAATAIAAMRMRPPGRTTEPAKGLLDLHTDVLLAIAAHLDDRALCRLEAACRCARRRLVACARPLWLPRLRRLAPAAPPPPADAAHASQWKSPRRTSALILPSEASPKAAVATHHAWSARLPALVRDEAARASASLPATTTTTTRPPLVAPEPVPATFGPVQVTPAAVLIDSLADDPERAYITTRHAACGAGCMQIRHGPIVRFDVGLQTPPLNFPDAAPEPTGPIDPEDQSQTHSSGLPAPRDSDPEKQPWPPLFRSFRSRVVPVNVGSGFVALWDPRACTCTCTFKAIDNSCQGQLVDDLFVCFDLQWSSETHMGRVVNCWSVADPYAPKLLWTTRHQHHVVDVAVNACVAAIALGTFVNDDDDDDDGEDDAEDASQVTIHGGSTTNNADGVNNHNAMPTGSSPLRSSSPPPSSFTVELRDRCTGVFLRRLDVLTGIRNVLCLTATRFHLLVLRATHDGTRILVVDMATGDFITDINLMRVFIRNYGGVQVSANERLMVLWSTGNRVAVVDVLDGRRWRLFERDNHDDHRHGRLSGRPPGGAVRPQYGVWVLTGSDDIADMHMYWKVVKYP